MPRAVASRLRLVSLFLVLPASGAWGALVAPAQPGTLPPAAVRVAGDASGLMAAAWAERDDGTGQGGPLHVAVSSDHGHAWTEHVLPWSGLEPRIAVSRSNRLDLFWLVWRSGTLGWLHARSDDGGQTFAERRSLDQLAGDDVAIAVADDGRIALAARSPGGELLVYRSDATAGSWWSTGVGNLLASPALAWLSAQDLLLCATELDGLSGSHLVSCRSSGDGGRTFAPPVEVTRRTTAPLAAEIAVRGPGDVILAAAGATDVWVVRSSDGGATWSAETLLENTPSQWSRPSLVAQPTGEVWLGSRALPQPTHYAPEPGPSEAALWTTADGVAWREVEMPLDVSHCVTDTPAVLLPSWREAVVVAGTRSWTQSPLTGWEAAASLGAIEPAAEDLRVVSLPSGRLVAAWTAGPRLPLRVLTSHSDDGGLAWAPPAALGDADLSLRRNPGSGLTDLEATADGGVVAVWLGRSGSGCAEVRAARSADGSSFAPSAVLGEATDPKLSVALAGDGSLVAAWVERDLLAARSADGGVTWAAPVSAVPLTGSPVDGSVLAASQVARASDGSLVVLAARIDPRTFSRPLWAARTADGGLTYSRTLVDDSAVVSAVELVAAGTRLHALLGCAPFCPGDYESADSGSTWAVAPVPIPHAPELAGDAAGNLYYSDGRELFVRHPDLTLDSLGTLLPSAARRDLLVRGPGDVAVLRVEGSGTSGVPGVHFDPAPCAAVRILSNPAPVNACEGASAILSVTASGDPNLAHQWYKDGAPVPGATGSTLRLDTLAEADAGHYLCVVSGSCMVQSESARVWVVVRPRSLGNSLKLVRSGPALSAWWDPDPNGDVTVLLYDPTASGAFAGQAASAARPPATLPGWAGLTYYRAAASNVCGTGPK